MTGHHDVDLRTALHEQARDLRRLVCSDAAGNSEDDDGCAHEIQKAIVRRVLHMRSASMIARKFSKSFMGVPLVIV